MFAEHFHHAAIAGQFAAVEILWQKLFHPQLLAALIDGLQAVGGGFIGPEHTQGVWVLVDGIPQQLAKGVGVFGL